MDNQGKAIVPNATTTEGIVRQLRQTSAVLAVCIAAMFHLNGTGGRCRAHSGDGTSWAKAEDTSAVHGKPVASWLADLRDKDREKRAQAAAALADVRLVTNDVLFGLWLRGRHGR